MSAEGFKLHGGLPFKADAITNPDQRRDCVEKTADARRRWRVDSTFNHLSRETQALGFNAVTEDSAVRSKIGPIGGRKMRNRHAPGFARSHVAALQRHVCEVGGATAFGAVDDEKFPAPDRAVFTESAAVKCNAYHRLGAAMLRQAREHVRVMVLYRDACCRCKAGRKPRRRVVRMQVVRDDAWVDVEQTDERSEEHTSEL